MGKKLLPFIFILIPIILACYITGILASFLIRFFLDAKITNLKEQIILTGRSNVEYEILTLLGTFLTNPIYYLIWIVAGILMSIFIVKKYIK